MFVWCSAYQQVTTVASPPIFEWGGGARDSEPNLGYPQILFSRRISATYFSSQPWHHELFFTEKRRQFDPCFSLVCSPLTLPHQTADSNNHTKNETVVLEVKTQYIFYFVIFTTSASHECLTVNRSSNSEFKINRINQSIGELVFKIGGPTLISVGSKSASEVCRPTDSWGSCQPLRAPCVGLSLSDCRCDYQNPKKVRRASSPTLAKWGCPAPAGSPGGDAHGNSSEGVDKSQYLLKQHH